MRTKKNESNEFGSSGEEVVGRGYTDVDGKSSLVCRHLSLYQVNVDFRKQRKANIFSIVFFFFFSRRREEGTQYN